MKRTKLQRLLNALDGTNQPTMDAIRSFDESVKGLRDTLRQEISAATLDEVNSKINKLRKSVDLNPLLQGVDDLKKNFEQSVKGLISDLEKNVSEQRELINSGNLSSNVRGEELTKENRELKKRLDLFVEQNQSQINNTTTTFNSILGDIKKLATQKELKDLQDNLISLDKTRNDEAQRLQAFIDKVRVDLMSAIQSKGGGSANRQIFVGGANPLTRYTDINLKAGSNVTITYANNNTTKKAEITIASSGGGGGGTVRSINSVSADTTAGATAGTDYVYLVSGTTTITLPTAVGNTNLYTIKNIGTGVVTIATTSAETIDNDSTIIMPVRYTSVDVISDTANWNIT